MQDTTDLLQIKIDNAKKQLSKETLDAIAAVPWQAEILKMRETKGYTFEQLEDLEIETELALCGLVSPKDYPKELESRMRLSRTQVNELVNEMNKQVFSKIQEELRKITERIPPPPAGGDKIFPSPSGRVREGLSTSSSKLATPQEGNTPDTEDDKKTNAQILSSAGIEIIPEKLELNSPLPEYSAPKAEGGGSVPPPLDKGRSEEGSLISDPRPTSPLLRGRGIDVATPAYQLAGRPQEGNNPPRPLSTKSTPKEGKNILSQKLSGSVKNEIVETDHSLNNLTPSNPPSSSPNKPIVDPYREIPE